MKIIDCPWELVNLDCRVAEVKILLSDDMDTEILLHLEDKYDYIVLKIESGSMSHTLKASELGYNLAETQLSIQKHKSDWIKVSQDEVISQMLSRVTLTDIKSNEDLEELMHLITPDMFSTDRIYLDPYFGSAYSENRYKNWIRSEFDKEGTILTKVMFRNKYIGFSLCKMLDNETMTCMLAGCFEKYRKSGLGFWIPLFPEIYGKDYRVYTTHISTNNMPVWQMYNKQNYEITNADYVFVKHTNNKNGRRTF